jgi:hypothetical protein
MKVEREARLQVLVDAGKIKWSAQNTVLKEREPNSAASITSLSEDKKWNKIYDLLHAYGMSQGGGEGCCNIHLKGSVMNGSTGKTSTLGVWLMRQRRQKAKGWIHPLREVKVRTCMLVLTIFLFTHMCVLQFLMEIFLFFCTVE